MNPLERFLKGKDYIEIDHSAMQSIDKRYQCTKCDKFSIKCFYDAKSFSVYWYCEDEHQSIISLGGKGV